MRFAAIAAGLVLAAAAPAQAAVLFTETFDGVAVGTYQAGAELGEWFTVIQGYVKVVESGTEGIACLGGAGRCIALDGPDTIIEAAVGERAGGPFGIGFSVSNSQREAEAQSFGFQRLVGDSYAATTSGILATQMRSGANYCCDNTPAGLTRIRFISPDTDGLGLVLDSLWVDPDPSFAPEPAAWSMLIAGFGMVGASLRRRERRTAGGQAPSV